MAYITRTIWTKEDDARVVQVIDQRFLPHQFVIEDIATIEVAAAAIKEMHVRGAGLIGATAGYGMYLAAIESAGRQNLDEALEDAGVRLKATRPTAVNLAWAVDRQLKRMAEGHSSAEKVAIALETARQIADEDAAFCERLGRHGLELIRRISLRKGEIESMSSPIATPDGWPSSISARRRHPSMRHTMRAFRSTSGWMRHVPEARGRSSPRGNSGSTACRIR